MTHKSKLRKRAKRIQRKMLKRSYVKLVTNIDPMTHPLIAMMPKPDRTAWVIDCLPPYSKDEEREYRDVTIAEGHTIRLYRWL